MHVRSRQVVFLVCLFLTGLTPGSQAQSLSKTQLAELGKAATALVLREKSIGSAFCVHSSGLFVTNAHVAPADAQNVRLVLDSGLTTQKILKARVVRADAELDLALLKAEFGGPFRSLALGSDQNLRELTEVVAFGFPLGMKLGEKRKLPTVSLLPGSVTSLKPRDGKLHRIQMDAGVHPGNSGGPVLNLSGKVIGVVVSGVAAVGVDNKRVGTTLSLAIPVSHLIRFMGLTEIDSSENEAIFLVLVPPNATVWVNEVEMTKKGPQREYRSSGLTPGNLYAYTIRAAGKAANGEQFDEARTVFFRGGERHVVDFFAKTK